MPNNNPSLYDLLVEADAQMDHHQSDLYVKATPETLAIIEKAKADDPSIFSSKFIDQESGETWIDLPFQYAPYWDEKEAVESPKP